MVSTGLSSPRLLLELHLTYTYNHFLDRNLSKTDLYALKIIIKVF